MIEMIPKFFVVVRSFPGKSLDQGTYAHRAADSRLGDAPKCGTCGRYVAGKVWLPPYSVDLETWGKKFGDLALSSPPDLLVTERFRRLWLGSRMVGLSQFTPVKVAKVRRRRRMDDSLPSYLHTAAVVTRTEVDYAASGFEWEKSPDCLECRLGTLIKRWKRIVLDPTTWSGEDLFVPFQLGDFVATSRFKEFCETNGIAGAVFVPAEEYGHDFYPGENVSDD